MSINKLLMIGLTSTVLTVSGCSSVTSTWDWFFEDDEAQVAEGQTSEEMDDEAMMEEEMMEEELDEAMMDEELDEEMMMEEEMMDEELDDEAMMEEDDYGDRPQTDSRDSRPTNVAIYFDYKSTAISASGLNILQVHSNQLMSNRRLNVVLVGHTDSVAPSDYNKRLSLKRAQAVAEALVRMGVSESRIRVRGAGEDSPAMQGDTDQANALNRRVEIIYQ